jgi:hypothetical protein
MKGSIKMSKKKVIELIIIVVTTAVYIAKAVIKFFERLRKPFKKAAASSY